MDKRIEEKYLLIYKDGSVLSLSDRKIAGLKALASDRLLFEITEVKQLNPKLIFEEK